MSLGDLSEEDVKGLRSGSIAAPPLRHVVALARAFDVEPSYLVDGYGETVFDRDTVEALGDDATGAIASGSAHLPDRERKLLQGIVREFEGAQSLKAADSRASSDGR